MNGVLLRPMYGVLLETTLGRSLIGLRECGVKGYSSRLARASLPSPWVQKSPPEHLHGALGRTLFIFALGLSKHLAVVFVDLPTSLLCRLEGFGGHALQDLFILLLAELRDEDIDIDQKVALTIDIDRRQTLTT